MHLNEIVPIGRSLDEYVRMFALTPNELLDFGILGCGDGPASFNAELSRRGGRVVSCDPVYAFSAEELRSRVHATLDAVIDQVREVRDRYVWKEIPDPDALRARRLNAMHAFLEDYVSGQRAGRYVASSLPNLPFPARSFDLALSSHFLFLYSDRLDQTFHVHSIREMCRVAHEARIFPLVDLSGQPVAFLDALLGDLRADGLRAGVERVDYEFQKGACEMLRVRHAHA